jgi:hypothetical protein
MQAFLKGFCEKYQDRAGVPYVVRRAKDPAIVKHLLKTYSLDMLRQMNDQLQTTTDAWIAATDRGIGILSVKANWLASRCKASTDQTPRRGNLCPHDPPCARRTACVERIIADGRAERAAAVSRESSGLPSDAPHASSGAGAVVTRSGVVELGQTAMQAGVGDLTGGQVVARQIAEEIR